MLHSIREGSCVLLLALVSLVSTSLSQSPNPSASGTENTSAAPTAIPQTSLPPDDDAIICNHVHPKGYVPEPVRCKNPVTASKILLFPAGAKPSIDFPIQNDRHENVTADCVLTVTNREEKQIEQKTASITLTSGTSTNFTYTFDTTGLKYGVYNINLRVSSGGQLITKREYYAGVTTPGDIPKSPPGAFLYGLDPNYGGVIQRAPDYSNPKRMRQGQCDLLGWIDAMGVDILRDAGIGVNHDRPLEFPDKEQQEDLLTIKKHGLCVTGMISPIVPNHAIPNGYSDEMIHNWTSAVEQIVARTPEIQYWELGNEPDLSGNMDYYVRIFQDTARAVKKGNPKAQVMNGGLSFFGAFGPGNSRRFLQLVDPSCFDVIAYHAHGFGSGAERNIYEMARKAAIKYGKGNLPFCDTESGMFVGSKKQEDAQAWMVVQKQAYAQAVGLKFLMTFRLHAFRSETGWGLLHEDYEPNPAILAYRAMTQNLKGLPYQATLALKQTNAEGYSFAQPNGPARACLIWSNIPAFYNVYVKIAASAKDARNARFMDIYGNMTPVDLSEDGIARVEVTQAPTYLLWNAADSAFKPSAASSMLRTPDMATVIPNDSTPLDFKIVNETDVTVTGTLNTSITASGGGSITPPHQAISVPAHGSVPASLSIKWSPPHNQVQWPSSWLAFTDLQESDVDLSQITELPSTIKGIAGRRVQRAANSTAIPLLRPGESPREKRPGFLFGNIHSEVDQVVKIGVAADWWLELRLNGKIVCSTMEKGNAAIPATDRVVELPLRKGDNLLSARILSGKGGWNLTLVPPSELSALLNPEEGTDRIDLSLEGDGKVLARERLALRPVRSVTPLSDIQWNDTHEEWAKLTPDLTLENANVTNLYDKQQDRSKWWQGSNDLSAVAWIRADSHRLYLVVRVLDDKDVTGSDPDKMPEFDSLQVAVNPVSASAGKDGVELYTIGRVDGKVTIFREESARGLAKALVDPSSSEINASIERDTGVTFYRVSLDHSITGLGVFGLNFLINDNDDGYRKQYIQWTGGLGEGENPSLWQLFVAPPASKHPTGP